MAPRFSRRNRIRITVVTVICLLLQQLAIAAYACPMGELPAGASAMAGCADASEREAPQDALCQKHCAPDTSTGAEARSAGVPLLALPPVVFQHDASRDWSPVSRGGAERWARSTAPPRSLAFTRLLI